MTKTKWDGAEDPTINYFEYALKSAHRPNPTAVYHINQRNTHWRQVSLGTHGPPAETDVKWKNKLERDFQISKHHLKSQREN